MVECPNGMNPPVSHRMGGLAGWRGAAMAALLTAIGPGSSAEPAPPPRRDACVECHQEQDEKPLSEPVRLMEKDVHRAAGFSCADCHGGDPNVSEDDNPYTECKDPKKGYLGTLERKAVAPLCARCHSDIKYMRKFSPRLRVDQYAEYLTSVHAEKVAEGVAKAATCTSCHGAHGILTVKDPAAPVYPTNVPSTCARCHADAEYMKPYKIPTNQYAKFAESQHGMRLLREKDTGAPACNTCHGNHGAVPPDVASVAHVCGNCHMIQAEDFEKSTHAGHFARQELPGCATCHDQHAVPKPGDHLLADTAGGACIQCHEKGDPCYQATGRMLADIRDFEAALRDVQALLDRAERLGMGVSQAKFEIQGAGDSLTQARVRIHQFKEEAVHESLKEGRKVVARAREAGRAALAERRFRRQGLAVSATIILGTVGLLLLKIRRIERDQARAKTAHKAPPI